MDVERTNDGNSVPRGLELPESDIDGDTTLTLGLQFVQNPGILEGTLSELSSLLLELLDGSLVDTTTLCISSATNSDKFPKESNLVDEMASGGGLSGVDVSDDDDVEMELFLTE